MGEQLALFDTKTMTPRCTWVRHHEGNHFDVHCVCGVVYRNLDYGLFEATGAYYVLFACPSCGQKFKVLDHSKPSTAP